MALNLIWSLSAEKEFTKTLLYWIKKNQSSSYSKKLNLEIINLTNSLCEFPNLGFKSNYKYNRIIITSSYKLIYEVSGNQIKVKRFFDVRRNPKLIKKF